MGIISEPPAGRVFGFSFVEIIIVIAVVGLLGALGVAGYRAYQDGGLTGASSDEGQCKATDGVNFCVTASATDISPSDGLTLVVTLTNRRPITYSTDRIYSSSCNDPSVTINDEKISDIGGVCTQDITAIEIDAGASRKYDLAVDTADLATGRNVIKLSWDRGKLTSKPIIVMLKQRGAQDIAREQSCLGEQDMKPYCASITIIFKDNGGSATCDELEAFIKPLGLAAVRSYCQMSDYGIMTAYVPKSQVEEWLNKVRGIPQVQSATKF